MDWLNYHHLLYFWTVAKEGSISQATRRLHLAQPTISAQIRELEQSLGEKLFERSGRRLVMTEAGRLVYRYADEIFALGREMIDSLKQRPTGRPLRLVVGIADAIPKLVAHRLLTAARESADEIHLVCREDRPERLFAQLAIHALDLVISDGPVGPPFNIRAYNHFLGECGISIYGTSALAEKYRRGFPASLNGAPMLLPTEDSMLRRGLDHWMDELGIRPRIVGEFDDPALMKVFGKHHLGLFPAAEIVAEDLRQNYDAQEVGRLPDLKQRFYAISAERKLKHPAVVAISSLARRTVF